MSDISGQISKDIARSLGEKHARSVSRVSGDGMAALFGGRGEGWATIVDLALVVGVMAAATGAVRPNKAIAIGGVALLLLWALGQSVSATHRYGR